MENKLFKLKSPLKVTLNITNRCNFKCIHCYNGSLDDINEKELTFEELESILKDLKKIETVIVSINGGEPFLRKDVLKILKKASDLGFLINLNTNASLITKDIAKELKNIKIEDIDVSFHADNRDHFLEFTMSKMYQETLRGIQNLIEVGIFPSIAFVATSKNIHWGPEIIKLMSKMKITSMHTITLIQRGRAIHNDLSLNMVDLKNGYNEMIKVAKKYKVDLSLDCPFNLYEDIISEESNIKLDAGCFGGRYLLCIQSNGNVTPCALFPEHVIGNVKEKKIKKIWDNYDPNFYRKDQKDVGICENCNLFKICYGGCPSSNYFPNKVTRDFYCPKINNI